MIIVCTQNSLSNTDKHFQHFFKNYITKGNEFNLVSKVDATRQSNRGKGLLYGKEYNKNVRTRVYLKENNRNNASKALKGIYFNPGRVNSKWKNSYNTNKVNGKSSNNNRRTITSIQNRDKLNQSKCKYELVRIDLERKTISPVGNYKSGKGYIIYYFLLREIKIERNLEKVENVSFPFVVVNNYSLMTLNEVITKKQRKK